jgi:hypothetical protein
MASSTTTEKDDAPTPTPIDGSSNNINDLEKQDTAYSATGTSVNPARSRISRTQSLTRNRIPGRFSHPLAHVKTTEAEIVDFDGLDDPYRPINWPVRKKVITTILYGLTTMGTTWSSAVYAPAIDQVSKEFHVGTEVSLLGVSFLMMGLGLGPMIFAPLSEVYGRKPAVLIPYFLAGVFSIGTATAKDIQTILITRFFTGLFGSAPVTNTGGVLGDIWSPQQRGTALVGYAFAVVAGPTLGPITGSAIVESYLRWRWTEYVSMLDTLLGLEYYLC